ncbi:unnamed protein product [Heterobilharzia americana]|nr:unnamed protein product [Heterobilharzia americana]CAH8506493.1 unnamed protein product [Heterobilharzia americana]
MCEVLVSTNQIGSLRHLLNRIPKLWLTYEADKFSSDYNHHHYQKCYQIKQSESITLKQVFESRQSIIKALAILSYQDKNYTLVYHLLKSNHFNTIHQSTLQQLWYNTHYAEVQLSRDKPLTAVDKYRIRRKYPLPYTIWDGEEIIYCFKRNVRCQLIEYYRQNQYPNSTEKYKIALDTGLSFTQVSNWFKNHRQRDKSSELTDTNNQLDHKLYITNDHYTNSLKKSINQLNHNKRKTKHKSTKQHLQIIKHESQIEKIDLTSCCSLQETFQSFNVQQCCTDYNSINENFNFTIENAQSLEYNQSSILYPGSSYQHSSCINSNPNIYDNWTTDYFNVEQGNHNNERNDLHYCSDYHDQRMYYTYGFNNDNNSNNNNDDIIDKNLSIINNYEYTTQKNQEMNKIEEMPDTRSYLCLSDEKSNYCNLISVNCTYQSNVLK